LCAPLQLATPFASWCFEHVMNKSCQYATKKHKTMCWYERGFFEDDIITPVKEYHFG